MQIATVDFESFWSSEYSLSKLSPLEYVLGEPFELISMAIKVDNYYTDVFWGEEKIKQAVHSLDWSTKGALAHNMSGFDSYIMAYRLGVNPRMWLDTLAMARPIHAKTTGLSLAKLVEHYGLGTKDNTILMNTRGKRLADFTQAERDQMATYNRADTEQCYALFHKLKPRYTAKELWQIDAITRMRTEPAFELDVSLLETAASVERSRKHAALLDLGKKLGVSWHSETGDERTAQDVEEEIRTQLASAPKFSELLSRLGVDTPMKPSPTNPEKQVPALAKTDEAFLALQDHDDPVVAAAARARLDVKSTLLETRIQKFLTAGRLAGGKLPVPLRYCGADTTGRDSGEEYNCQNLPAIRGESKPAHALRNSMRAPRGMKIIVADQSGIELRVNHFLWKVPSSMALYAKDAQADLYKAFAAARYMKPVDEVTKGERHLAKLCLAEGTLVLTDTGPKPIESISVLDLLWDGVEWVSHDGPAFMGEKEVITYDGLTATPDHEVWVEDGRTVRLEDASAQSLRLARTGEGRTPLGFGGTRRHDDTQDQGVQARDGAMRGMRGYQAGELQQSRSGEDPGVPIVPSEMRGAHVATYAANGSEAAMLEPERLGVPAVRRSGGDVRFSVRGGRRSLGGEQPTTGPREGTGPDRQQQGVRAGESSFRVAEAECSEPSTVEVYSLPHVSGGSPRGSVCGYHASPPSGRGAYAGSDRGSVVPPVRQAKRRVWDILNAGPRHRFTAGGRLVSNCQLGLGFGSGAATFQRIAKTMGGLKISHAESESLVSSWRTEYCDIVNGWKLCGEGVLGIMQGVEQQVDPWGLIHTCREGFVLPSGRMIRYPHLRKEEDGAWPDGRRKVSYFYGEGRHKARITGPKSDENLVQALARDSIFDCAVEFFKATGLRPALRVHDELVYVVPEREADTLLETLQAIMRTPPKWWPQLVVWSAGDAADTYGAAK